MKSKYKALITSVGSLIIWLATFQIVAVVVFAYSNDIYMGGAVGLFVMISTYFLSMIEEWNNRYDKEAE